ncbi:MAG: Crp/Fnr family transcriptional regulator [Aureispira sp.]|nr:Crp/Fnr family transcriptional regulator [Aureispira sp.]
MTQLEQYIHNFLGISYADLKGVVSLFEADTLTKGEFFVKQGHYCKRLSFIKEGYIRVYAATEKKEVTQWISTKDYFITDLASLIFGQPARWNIQALTDCSLYSISEENYKKIGTLVPQWDKLEKQFIAKCFITLEDRVFSFLSMTAEERYDALFHFNSELFNQVSLHYLASMLGMTPETLSRIRKKRSS